QSHRDQTNQDQFALTYYDCHRHRASPELDQASRKPVTAQKLLAWAHRKFQRNFTSALVVSFGFYSSTQWTVTALIFPFTVLPANISSRPISLVKALGSRHTAWYHETGTRNAAGGWCAVPDDALDGRVAGEQARF